MSQRRVSQNNDVDTNGSAADVILQSLKPVNGSTGDGNTDSTNSDSKPAALPDIDLAELRAEPASLPKLSVEADFDLEALRAGPEAETTASPDFDTVEVRKPKKTTFIYLHSEWRIDMYLLLPDETERRYTHAVLPDVARKFPKICRKHTLVPYADRENGMYLWPIPLEDATGNLNDYSRSALKRVCQGAGQWCRYEADLAHQRYAMYIQHEQIAAPEWPAGGLSHLVKAAFQGNIIANAGAEILRQRMGRLVKDDVLPAVIFAIRAAEKSK
jgi:hypothetical protein